MADAPNKASEAPAKKAQTEFKILDVREDTKDVTLELEDGRVIPAALGDNINAEDLKRGRIVNIKFDGLDRSDAPKDAVVTRILPKDD